MNGQGIQHPRSTRKFTLSYILACVGLIALLIILEILGTAGGTIDIVYVGCSAIFFLHGAFAARTMTQNAFLLADRSPSGKTAGAMLASTMLAGAVVLTFSGPRNAPGVNLLPAVVGGSSAFIILNTCIAPQLRKSGEASVPAFLGRRYASRSVRALAALVCLPVSAALLVAAFVIASTVLEVTFALPALPATIVVAAFALLGTLFGGMRSFATTTGILLSAMALATIAVCLPQFLMGTGMLEGQTGGASLPRAPAPGGDLEPSAFDPWSAATLMLSLAAAIASTPLLHAPYFAARDIRSSRSASAWALALIFLFTLSFSLLPYLGMNGTVPQPSGLEVESPDIAGSVAALLELPPALDLPQVWSALIATGLLAACLAIASLTLAVMGAMLSNDIIFAAAGRKADTALRLFATRVGMIVLAIGSAIAATIVEHALLPLIAVTLALCGACLFFPLVLGIWWKKPGRIAASAGIVGGFTASSGWLYHLLVTAEPWLGLDIYRIAVPGLAGSLIFMLIATMLQRGHASKDTAQLVEQLHFPVEASP
ncbi:sodium:solute symporter family transporter [Nitratireductor basaltis]|uniref:Na+/solute symporter (Ssf family) protein n=1 Tax=Nitratireductor basaltis TaxID=472175 RepID=A0A084UAH4_9HYPH|nr:hypothetical protein [Nitratireductor basaltis]KFB09960.1 Na+/solute symporter (Ssf family) protein [Nitratireductor basaltis]